MALNLTWSLVGLTENFCLFWTVRAAPAFQGKEILQRNLEGEMERDS